MEAIETRIENGLQILDEKEQSLIELRGKYLGLSIKGIEDKDGYKKVREARLSLKNARIQIEKDGKSLRENAVRFSKRVIERERELISIIEPTESELEQQEDHFDQLVNAERERKEREENERIQKRINALIKFNYGIDMYDAKIMPDAEYNELLSRVEAEYNAEQQRIVEIKAEEERQRIAEQERIRLEREEFARQKAEFEKREADLKALRDKELHEQQEREAKIKAEQDRKEAELKAERAKLDAERIAIKEEKFNQRKQIIIDSLGLHSNGMYFTHKVFNLRVAESVVRDLDDSAFSLFIEECRNTIESEKVALEKRIAEEKAESERLAELKRQRQESLKPDKQKLFDLATRLMQVELPELRSVEANVLLQEVGERIAKLSELIHEKAQSL